MEKTKIYVTLSGQEIRQSQRLRRPRIVRVEERESDWPYLSECEGQDNYTSSIWATDFETVKRWVNGWAGREVKLRLYKEEGG